MDLLKKVVAISEEMKLDVKHGQIGPKHDPYGTEERIVKKDGKKIVFYTDGLGTMKVTVDGKEVAKGHDGDGKMNVNDKFKELTGLTMDTFDKAYNKIHKKDMEDPMGHPSQYEGLDPELVAELEQFNEAKEKAFKLTAKALEDLGLRGEVGRKGGNLCVRMEYYWTPQKDVSDWAEGVIKKINAGLKDKGVSVVKVAHGNEWKPFKGGGSTKENSHYWVTFKEDPKDKGDAHAAVQGAIDKAAKEEMKEAVDPKWKNERLKGCTCKNSKEVNPNCRIHGTGKVIEFEVKYTGKLDYDEVSEFLHDELGVYLKQDVKKTLLIEGDGFNQKQISKIISALSKQFKSCTFSLVPVKEDVIAEGQRTTEAGIKKMAAKWLGVDVAYVKMLQISSGKTPRYDALMDATDHPAKPLKSNTVHGDSESNEDARYSMELFKVDGKKVVRVNFDDNAGGSDPYFLLAKDMK
jgi:hypothetical protein